MHTFCIIQFKQFHSYYFYQSDSHIITRFIFKRETLKYLEQITKKMPRRKDKGTDTQQSDEYDIQIPQDRPIHYGNAFINRYVPPDELPEDDPSRYSIRVWSNVLQARRLIEWKERKQLFERVIKCLPYSYKVWYSYLKEYVDYCSNRSLYSKEYDELNKLFERALEKLPKMPRIWLLYAETLAKQNLISKTRLVYNWCFRNLPLTQHEKIWAKYSAWVLTLENSRTANQVIPRYLKLNPDFKEVYSDYLKERKQADNCAKVLKAILDDEGYNSKSGRSKYDFFLELVQVLIDDPLLIKSVNGEQIIRDGIRMYPDEAGQLWVRLSDYFIRMAEFQRARETLEEALNTIESAKDFGLIFNAYCKFQEQMITALANEELREQQAVVPEDEMDAEIEKRLAKLENLIERQPYLLYNINLRKNKNDVKTWLKLIDLYRKNENLQMTISTLERCISTINSEEAENGKYSQIWVYYAKLYQSLGDMRKCNLTFHRATSVNFKAAEDYINVWTRWAEILIIQGYPKDALSVVKHVLFRRRIDADNLKIKNIDDILKSSPLIWSLYIDIEAEVGTFDSAKMAYNRCKQHKSLTPLMILNYVNMLWHNSHFQEVFRVFEFAVGHFKWPNVYEIWLAYLTRFIQRYGHNAIGVERARSIFERLMKEVPQDKAKLFYFMYAQFQEKYGLYSHTVEIYERLINEVPVEQRFECYNIYIAKVANLLGVTKTRAIFEAALQKLTEEEIILMAIKYAELQKNLGEVERARGVYIYATQFADPADDSEQIWAHWENFEVQFGNKDSYKQYLRIKRAVAAKFAMLPPDVKKLAEKVKKGQI